VAMMMAIAVAALFGLGAAAGFVALISLGARHEERYRAAIPSTRERAARERAPRGARVGDGVHDRRPVLVREAAAYYRQDVPGADLDR
jgi:hypothetical protein